MTDKDAKKPISDQTLKAKARRAAKAAPPVDIALADQAIKDAQRVKAERAREFPKQKATPLGQNIHHDKAAILSDFDAPKDD